MKKLFFMFGLLFVMASATVEFDKLQWQDNNDCEQIKLNWDDAKKYCEKLSLLNYQNWRLPTIVEMQSTIDVRRAKKNRPTIKKGFKYINNDNAYWTITSNIENSDEAWVVKYDVAHLYPNGKAYKKHVRCVRDK